MKYIIIGQNASGRNHLAHELEKNGFSIAKTYVTNEAFFENDFMTTDDDSIYNSEIISKKEYVRGHYRIITRDMIDNGDVIIADEDSLVDILTKSPTHSFTVIITEAPKEKREVAYENKKVGFRIFDREPFGNFNNRIQNITKNTNLNNSPEISIFHNDYTNESTDILIGRIKIKTAMFNKITILAKELARMGKIHIDDDNNVALVVITPDKDVSQIKMPFDVMIGNVISNNNRLAEFMGLLVTLMKKPENIRFCFDEE